MWNWLRCVLLLAMAFLPVVDVRADESIRLVQKKLQALGYYKGKVDGASGSMTNAAIRRFQLAQNLKVMDATALTLCRDQKLPINVFSIFKPQALKRVVMGEDEGTMVHV